MTNRMRTAFFLLLLTASLCLCSCSYRYALFDFQIKDIFNMTKPTVEGLGCSDVCTEIFNPPGVYLGAWIDIPPEAAVIKRIGR